MVLNVLFALDVLSNQRKKDAHCRYTNNLIVQMHTKTIKMKTTNNKTTNGMSKATIKAVETINTIKAQETKSAFDLQKLANAIYKVEAKSISHIYKQVSALYSESTELGDIVRELAGAKMPTFKAFATAYKGTPCLWYGFATLRKLNPKFKLAEKVKRQNKATAKK